MTRAASINRRPGKSKFLSVQFLSIEERRLKGNHIRSDTALQLKQILKPEQVPQLERWLEEQQLTREETQAKHAKETGMHVFAPAPPFPLPTHLSAGMSAYETFAAAHDEEARRLWSQLGCGPHDFQAVRTVTIRSRTMTCVFDKDGLRL